MDDATTDEQPVVGFVERLAFLFVDKALRRRRAGDRQRQQADEMGDRCSWGTHEPAAQVIIKARNKASESNAVASCRKVQHTPFFFMILPPFDLKPIINTSLTICIDNHLLTLILAGQPFRKFSREGNGGTEPTARSKVVGRRGHLTMAGAYEEFPADIRVPGDPSRRDQQRLDRYCPGTT